MYIENDYKTFDRIIAIVSTFSLTINHTLRMMEATVFLGTFNATEMFCSPYPALCLATILSRSSTDNSFDLLAWFLL